MSTYFPQKVTFLIWVRLVWIQSFLFFKISYCLKAKRALFIVGRRREGYLPFPWILRKVKYKQPQSQLESYQRFKSGTWCFLNTQYYKVRIKGKCKHSGKGITSSPTPWYSSFWKGSLWVALHYGRPVYIYDTLFTLLTHYEISRTSIEIFNCCWP